MTRDGFSLVPPKNFSGTVVPSIASEPPFEDFVQETSVAASFPHTVHVIVWLSPSNTSPTVEEISTVSNAATICTCLIDWCLAPTLTVFQLYRGVQNVHDSEQNTNVLIQI